MKDSIQAQLIAARRSQILDAATTVFAEKGFHPTTIKDIAKVAGIADGTIYNYFENKTALLLGILDRLNETYFRQRFTVQLGNLEVFQVVLSEIMVNKELREQYYRQIVEPTFTLAEKYFQTLIDQHKARPVDVALTMRAISSMFLGLIILRIMGDKPLQTQWDDLPDLLTDLMFDGLSLTGSE